MSATGRHADTGSPSIPLDDAARTAWDRATALWNVHMHDPELRPGAGAEHGAPAWFTFPPEIVVDTAMVAAFGGSDELESVFAHELGHHVLAPSTRIDALKIHHQLARALAATGAQQIREDHVGMLGNLWNDLLVNMRVAALQRRRDGEGEPGIVRFSRAIYRDGYNTKSRLWWVYLRTYELLWNLPAQTLCPSSPPPPAPRAQAPKAPATEVPLDRVPERHREKERQLRIARAEAARIAVQLESAITTHPELDADLLAGIVRTFAADPVGGALRFGVLAAPYLVEEKDPAEGGSGGLGGSGGCAADGTPATADELGRVMSDRRLSDPVPARAGRAEASGRSAGDVGQHEVGSARADGRGEGQALDLARTLELYSSADADEVLAAWYRAEAARWVKPYTQRRPSRPAPELPGPIEAWEVGDDLADIDWSATLQKGPDIVPGVTTRRRSWLEDEPVPQESSIELDLYIDSSGSMPHPRWGSAPVLAGTILALSILRGGGRVRVTSFSGPGEVAGSETFTRDPGRVVRDLAWFFGRSTTFPLDLLERRYAPLPEPRDGQTRHLVVLSDDGLTSMFGTAQEQYAHVAAATSAKLTTGTLVLLPWAKKIEPVARAAGYSCLFVKTMEEAPAACARLAEVLHG